MQSATPHQFRHGKTQAARNFSYSIIRQNLQRVAAGQPLLATSIQLGKRAN
jgi:hypothetical protein